MLVPAKTNRRGYRCTVNRHSREKILVIIDPNSGYKGAQPRNFWTLSTSQNPKAQHFTPLPLHVLISLRIQGKFTEQPRVNGRVSDGDQIDCIGQITNCIEACCLALFEADLT